MQGLQEEKGWDVDARLLMYAAGLELGSGLARETANGVRRAFTFAKLAPSTSSA